MYKQEASRSTIDEITYAEDKQCNSYSYQLLTLTVAKILFQILNQYLNTRTKNSYLATPAQSQDVEPNNLSFNYGTLR